MEALGGPGEASRHGTLGDDERLKLLYARDPPALHARTFLFRHRQNSFSPPGWLTLNPSTLRQILTESAKDCMPAYCACRLVASMEIRRHIQPIW